MKKNLAMAFGIFDRLHDGHRAFLRQARRHGGKLIVVVARDKNAARMKKREPSQSERKRLAGVRAVTGVSRAILGDRQEGKYGVIRKFRPDIICVGYDQQPLGRDLQRGMREGIIPRLPVIRLQPYHPHKFKSSLLRGSHLAQVAPGAQLFPNS